MQPRCGWKKWRNLTLGERGRQLRHTAAAAALPARHTTTAGGGGRQERADRARQQHTAAPAPATAECGSNSGAAVPERGGAAARKQQHTAAQGERQRRQRVSAEFSWGFFLGEGLRRAVALVAGGGGPPVCWRNDAPNKPASTQEPEDAKTPAMLFPGVSQASTRARRVLGSARPAVAGAAAPHFVLSLEPNRANRRRNLSVQGMRNRSTALFAPSPASSLFRKLGSRAASNSPL